MASIAQPLGHVPIFFFNDLHGPAYGTLGPRAFFFKSKIIQYESQIKSKIKKKKKQ